MKSHEIFTPNSLPIWTFVDDHLQEKGHQLVDALEDGTALVSISGPSKSGKTVFVEHWIGRENLIQITGAGIASPGDLWIKVFHLIGTDIPQSVSSGESKSGSATSQAEIEGSVFVAKAKGGVSGTRSRTADLSEEKGKAVDYLQLLIQELSGTGLIIFIDDFHYIPRPIQTELAKQIKEAIRQGVLFIISSVPYHSDDVIRSNPDLRGRIFSLDFNYWGSDFLKMIAYKGFEKANLDCSDTVINFLAIESAGSPQLMQFLCLNTCLDAGVKEIPNKKITLDLDQTQLEHICFRTVQSTDYSSIVDMMIEGPKPRGATRKVFQSNLGWQGDVYVFLVKALSIDPPQLNFRYQALVDRIKSICEKETPSGSSITSACQHATSIANDAAETAMVEWDGENDVFDIRDPYLLFYLRWADPIG